ncbi:probable receptor-like protein kinase [Tanacetum coccineum]
MEDRTANIIAIASIVNLITLIIITRIIFHLTEPFFLVLGASLAAIVAVAVIYILRQKFHTRRQVLETRMASEGKELRIEYSFLRKVAGLPTKFRIKELEDATSSFNKLIGKGASGSVFKGRLSDGTEIAVKRIQHGEEKGAKEFRSEISAIASVQHVNLPENILIDENYNAVVSDFGISKLMKRDDSRIVTGLRGTRGYIAPEWMLGLGISEKTDVFSFGIVLLELVGGRRSVKTIDDGGQSKKRYEYFPKIVVDKLKSGKIMEAVDQRLLEQGEIGENEVKNLVNIALWCIQHKPRRRPNMVDVVKWLEGRVAVEQAPETTMIVVDLLSIDKDHGENGGWQNGNKRRKPGVVAKVASQVGCLVPGSMSLSKSKSFTYSLSIISPR